MLGLLCVKTESHRSRTILKPSPAEGFPFLISRLLYVRSGNGTAQQQNGESIMQERILGDLGFMVKWDLDDFRAEAAVFEIVGLLEGDPSRPLYQRKDSDECLDPIESLDEAEPYLTYQAKWDGCSHFWMADYYHWDGAEGYQKHCALIKYLFERAQELIKKADPEMFEGPWKEFKPYFYNSTDNHNLSTPPADEPSDGDLTLTEACQIIESDHLENYLSPIGLGDIPTYPDYLTDRQMRALDLVNFANSITYQGY